MKKCLKREVHSSSKLLFPLGFFFFFWQLAIVAGENLRFPVVSSARGYWVSQCVRKLRDSALGNSCRPIFSVYSDQSMLKFVKKCHKFCLCTSPFERLGHFREEEIMVSTLEPCL